jgi:hypothetical protein
MSQRIARMRVDDGLRNIRDFAGPAPGCRSRSSRLRVRNDDGNHFPVFTLVHSRLMMRCVAGSRALMTNSFFCVASSG